MLASNNKKVRHIHKFKRSDWKMVNELKQGKRVGRRSLQKNHKRKGWLLQSRVQRGGSWPFHKMRSMDSTGEKHIVLCIHFQHPAPSLSGWRPKVGTQLNPSIPELGQPQNSPSPGSSSYCIMLCLFQSTCISFTLFQLS